MTKYTSHKTEDYIADGFSDFIFVFFDSDDFKIAFDENKYSCDNVVDTVYRIVYDNM